MSQAAALAPPTLCYAEPCQTAVGPLMTSWDAEQLQQAEDVRDARRLAEDTVILRAIAVDLGTMIVLQGDADPVVPKNQSDAVVAALAANGVPHAYLVFPGVAHGFRDAETIITALEAELSFFCQILGIEPAGDLPELTLS